MTQLCRKFSATVYDAFVYVGKLLRNSLDSFGFIYRSKSWIVRRFGDYHSLHQPAYADATPAADTASDGGRGDGDGDKDGSISRLHLSELLSKNFICYQFGVLYSFCVYMFFAGAFWMPEAFYFDREKFSVNILLELGMFIVMFLCLLYFFGPIKFAKRPTRLNRDLRRIFLCNVISIFLSYGFFLLINFVVFSNAEYCVTLFKLFFLMGMNLHSQDYSLLIIKFFYLLLVPLTLYMVGRYFLRGQITFQFMSLVALALWAGLFVMNLNNLFFVFLLVDGISMATVALIILSAPFSDEDALNNGVHYFFYSIFTSMAGYIGCFLWYLTFKTIDVNAIIFLGNLDFTKFTFVNLAFWCGSILIILKLMFLFGVFPYQYVIAEVGKKLSYGYLFFFLVTLKLPMIVVFVKIVKVLWIYFKFIKVFFFIIGFMTLLYTVCFIATTDSIKHFLTLSSMNNLAFVLMLFSFPGLEAAFLGIMFYFLYAIGNIALYIFFSAVSPMSPSGRDDIDIETWLDLRRLAGLTASLERSRVRWFQDHDIFNPSTYYLWGVMASSLSVIMLSGLPPLGLFYVKLAFFYKFINSQFYILVSVIMLSTVLTLVGYITMLVGLNTSNVVKPKPKYLPKVVLTNGVDGILFVLSFLTIFVVSAIAADSRAYDWFMSAIGPFFTHDHYHVILANAESESIKKITFLGAFFSGPAIAAFWDRCRKIAGRTRDFFKDLFTFHNRVGLEENLFGNKNSKFFGGFYKMEFAAVTTICALVYYSVCFLGCGELVLFKWWFWLLHVIIANFLCWVVGYNIFYNVLLYRILFGLYVVASIIPNAEFWMCFLLKNAYWPAVEWFATTFGFSAPEYGVGSILTLVWAYVYYFSYGAAFWFLVISWGCSARARWFDFRAKFNAETSDSARADLVRELVRESFYDVSVIWIGRYLAQWWSAFFLYFAFGPFMWGSSVFTHHFTFFFGSVWGVFLVLTLNLFLIKLFLWAAFFIYMYCWYMNLSSVKALDRFINRINLPTRKLLKSPARAFCFVIFIIICFFLPVFFASGASPLALFVSVYKAILYPLQTVLVNSWFVVGCIALSYALMLETSGLVPFTFSVFYLSTSVTLFFVNLAAAYSLDHNCSVSILSSENKQQVLELLSFTKYDYFGIFAEAFSFLNAPIFTFGYDYTTLVFCVMSSAVFSFVFFISIFNKTLFKKKLFLLTLLVLQIFTLMTFLSVNLLGFIIFFESSLLPMAFLIGYWGSSYKKWFAAKMFFFYSAVASLPAMAAVLYLYHSLEGKLDYLYVLEKLNTLSYGERWFVWLSFFLMFAVKVPLFPAHSWLLNAHVEATAGVSIILASVMLKVGTFGFVRYLLGLLPELSIAAARPVSALAVASIFFAAICSITERDAKRLVALTSISHMGMVILALFMFGPHAFFGAVYLMVGHGVTSTALFYLIGILYDRFHTRDLSVLGGLVSVMPLYCSALFFFAMANAGFPWSLSFVGEFHIFVGLAQSLSLWTFAILVVCCASLLYSNLRLFMSISFGTLNHNLISNAVSDLSFLELFSVLLLVAHAFGLMWGNDFFFHPMYHDLLWRHILGI